MSDIVEIFTITLVFFFGIGVGYAFAYDRSHTTDLYEALTEDD